MLKICNSVFNRRTGQAKKRILEGVADSLFDILQNKNFDELPEAAAIKQFVLQKYNKSVAVTVRDKDITVAAQGAAFTNALRMQARQLQKAAQTEKRLIFRIA